MNILYLLKILKTNKLSELIANMDMPPIDYNLAVWEAVANGELEIDEEKDKVKALKEAEPSHDPVLATKIIRVMQHYARDELNINRGRLNSYVKDPVTAVGYGWHDYLTTLQYLIDTGQIIEQIISVPGVKDKRPPHKFAFLCLPENQEISEEWNSKQINNFIATWKPDKVN